MKRTTLILQKGSHDKIVICVDAQNASTILQYLFDASVFQEYLSIQGLLFERLRNKTKYCKADVSKKADNMYEMRFTNNDRNDRIYCQEQSVGDKRFIIMVELYRAKKTEGISKKYKSRIETMGGYNYEY